MTPAVEFTTAVLDAVALLLVTPDLVGKERLRRGGDWLRRYSSKVNNSVVLGATIPICIFLVRGFTQFSFAIGLVFLAIGILLTIPALAMMNSIERRYSFSGLLLAIGALLFATSRVLVMVETFPR